MDYVKTERDDCDEFEVPPEDHDDQEEESNFNIEVFDGKITNDGEIARRT
jgi:hypothetical protein